MIGVLAKDGEQRAVEEFFQLFKTPWELWQPGRHYSVVLATREEIPQDLIADALIVCQARAIPLDHELGLAVDPPHTGSWLEWLGIGFPIYGDIVSFRGLGTPLICSRDYGVPAGIEISSPDRPTVRIGYDLFGEVAFLLTHGQPAENARLATLDIHIALLRRILKTLQVPYVEIPPAPYGYDFAVCLTHDVDFIGIREHKFDHTMWGFLYRATVASLFKALKGRLSWGKCLRNWGAALSLPLVHLGLASDFWLEFDRYAQIEKDLGSTFFFIPFKNTAGMVGSAPAPERRAAKYDLNEIQKHIDGLLDRGCEVGLHGIDAWQNPQRAQMEQTRICEATGHSPCGIRMHWLYWNEDSPAILEQAGFTYDSTVGYNDAVGFRAGTAQPFCPPSANQLLELPLNIQDSAMFYDERMSLSDADALNACRDVIRTVASSGGVLTINWHTRSLSPERLWGDFYVQLIRDIHNNCVWFGTAQEITSWFRARRALRFDSVQFDTTGVRIKLGNATNYPAPPFKVTIHAPTLGYDSSEFSSSSLSRNATQVTGENSITILMDAEYCETA